MQVTLIQITDTHLRGDKQPLRGMNTQDSLHSVLDLVKSHEHDISLVLATGDVSHDGSEESYQVFLNAVTPLSAPIAWLPGNHDQVSVMTSAFAESQTGSKSIQLGNWRLILLNSQVEGEIFGHLSTAEITFLDRELARCEESHLVISLHHQCLPVGSSWLDAWGLRNADELLNRIESDTRVKAVLCGHVHQEADVKQDRVRLLAAPSTCFQFRPKSSEAELSDEAPGYRWIDLHENGEIVTGINRLMT
jgi:Icc protein